MANPIAIPGTNVPSSSLVTPGGAQGVQGIQGPSAVSANAPNLAKLGTDNLILVPPPLSADAGNLIRLGSDSLLYGPQAYYGADSTNSGVYAITVDSSFKLYSGVTVWVNVTNANNIANPTLNVNGTGAKPLASRANAPILYSGEIVGGRIFGAIYSGASWLIFTPLTRVYTVVNPGNINLECAGFDAVYANINFSAATSTALGLYHLNYSVPVQVRFVNNYSAGCAYALQCTNPAGGACNVYVFLTMALAGAAPSLITGANTLSPGQCAQFRGMLEASNNLMFGGF
jgi:hypothetical protein